MHTARDCRGPDLGFRKSELRALGCDCEVSSQNHFEAASEGKTVHSSDDRFETVMTVGQAAVARCRDRVVGFGLGIDHYPDTAFRTEGLDARPGEDRDPQAIVICELVERFGHLRVGSR